jgi:hypothetical protein
MNEGIIQVLALSRPLVMLSPMRLTTLSLVALTLACSQQTPEAAYRAFVQAAQNRESDKVWAMLSKDTQKRLDAMAQSAADAAPGLVSEQGRGASGSRFILGNAIDTSRAVAKDGVRVLQESRERAVLRVIEEGGLEREVTLVREGDWRVDLGDLLR